MLSFSFLVVSYEGTQGLVSPLGLNVAESWERLLAAQSGVIRARERIKDQEIPENTVLGLVPEAFESAKWKVPFVNTRTTCFGLAACNEALVSARTSYFPSHPSYSGTDLLEELSDPRNEALRNRTGVSFGVLCSNVDFIAKSLSKVHLGGFNSINRLTMLNVLNNMNCASISLAHKLQGPTSSPSTACSTGASAIHDAFNFIKSGDANVMLAGSGEEATSPFLIHACLK